MAFFNFNFNFLKKILGSRNQRLIKRYQALVLKINALEAMTTALSIAEIQEKTKHFKAELENLDIKLDAKLIEQKLTEYLPLAFALVREASKRALNMRHFDVQLIGGMALHEGKISEMRTGEGKTLMATLPAYLNALVGKSVHIVTVNDYLAHRDAAWMRPVYELLGLTVGTILHGQSPAEKQQAYRSDIVYGTNNEFGFDYLRDNMALQLDQVMQGPLYYALIDEVDSILIDEARTPLIISGRDSDSSELYLKINQVVPKLTFQKTPELENSDPAHAKDVILDEKDKQAYLTESGHQVVEKLFEEIGLIGPDESLYDLGHISLMHHLNAGLRAHHLFTRDVDYIIKNQQVIIVDEHTGRTMEGRRWSDGLHQAIEAKENVPIQAENQTLASITFQNYFRQYSKLSGMTGTADTEAYEFQQIYNLEVVVIPTNKKSQRIDQTDLVYLTFPEKFDAIIQDIQDCQMRQQPVLVGTVSIETSEYLSGLLKQKNIKHQVLNAKYHEQEAQIIAEAGRPGAVTIATNMAGRGTDIVLGGNLESEIKQHENLTESDLTKIRADWAVRHDAVLAAGGLKIIGTERHESRRIDNQLRGRCARQGDPGETQFYLSIKDNLMRIFISERISALLTKFSPEPGQAISHRLISNAIENAQRKVEGHHFDTRKQLLEFDNVANDQRQVIYHKRRELLELNDIQAITDQFVQMQEWVIGDLVDQYIPPRSMQELWEIERLEQKLSQEYGLSDAVGMIQGWLEQDHNLLEDHLKQKLLNKLSEKLVSLKQKIGPEQFSQVQKMVLLQVLDTHWKDHLATMDALRQGVHLRGYAQKDPKQEYKREAFTLFNQLLIQVRRETVAVLCRLEVGSDQTLATELEQLHQPTVFENLVESKPDIQTYLSDTSETSEIQARENRDIQAPNHVDIQQTVIRAQPKIGRNDPCHCGSGRKYKQCHGQLSVLS